MAPATPDKSLEQLPGGAALLPFKDSSALSYRDLPEECLLLRIFFGEADEYMHRPLYRAIVLRARELGLAGATVLRGPMGFGRSSHLHNAHILRLSLDLPVVVEIVDEPGKIKAFLAELQKMMRGGLISLERAQVFRYKR
jgi:PII-like signaling protein